ncbi:hypothetical protein GCM10023336_03100 [Streptomyces similanensis]|uniref:Uncharacterized protein n=1 Tax=Streptomyces similanensis TaxID=1274988 RepID=A0ABP9JSP0_9ACTN
MFMRTKPYWTRSGGSRGGGPNAPRVTLEGGMPLGGGVCAGVLGAQRAGGAPFVAPAGGWRRGARSAARLRGA